MVETVYRCEKCMLVGPDLAEMTAHEKVRISGPKFHAGDLAKIGGMDIYLRKSILTIGVVVCNEDGCQLTRDHVRDYSHSTFIYDIDPERRSIGFNSNLTRYFWHSPEDLTSHLVRLTPGELKLTIEAFNYPLPRPQRVHKKTMNTQYELLKDDNPNLVLRRARIPK